MSTKPLISSLFPYGCYLSSTWNPDAILKKILKIKEAFVLLGFTVGCHRYGDSDSKKQAGTSQIPICPCPKTVNLLLNLYKLYHIKNRYTVFPDMNLEIDQAMKLFKEEILDLVLPNL